MSEGSGSLPVSEIYDPVVRTQVQTGTINTNRNLRTATLLAHGRVLVAGGENNGGNYFDSAEWYDPASGVWTVTGPLNSARERHTATLLAKGKLLIAGGKGYFPGILLSAELYDVGLGFDAAWQPQIAAATSLFSLGGTLGIAGSGFRGVSGGSVGNSQDSPADCPVVQLRSLDGGQTLFLPSTNWSANSFTSAPVNRFPPGYALVTVFVNGIPGTSSIVNLNVPVPTAPVLRDAKTLTDGSFQFAFTNTVGALFGVLTTTNLALPSTNWTAPGGVTEMAPGQFQFTDPQATNGGLRFYRVRSP